MRLLVILVLCVMAMLGLLLALIMWCFGVRFNRNAKEWSEREYVDFLDSRHSTTAPTSANLHT